MGLRELRRSVDRLIRGRGSARATVRRCLLAAGLALLVLAALALRVAFALGRGAGIDILGASVLGALALLAASFGACALRALRAAVSETENRGATSDLPRILLDNLMTHFPGYVYFKDRESRFIRISDSLTRHFGLKHEAEALCKTDFDMFGDEHARQAMADEKEIMRSGKPRLSYEEKENWTDGRVGWVSSSKLPLRDDRGSVIGVFGVSLDISERKGAVEGLKESQAFFDSLVNSLPQNIYCMDLDGRITFGNRAFCATVGKPLEDLLGKTQAEVAPGERASKYREDDERVVQTGQPFETIEEMAGSDGRPVYRHLIKTPRYNSERRIVGLQGIFWDVTRRQRAEQQLMRERDLLGALMDNIPDCIFFKDARGAYTRINRAQARLLGLGGPEEAVGTGDLPPDEAMIVSTGTPAVGQMERITAPGGGQRWMLTTKVPICGEDGRVRGLVGIARDITERKLAEQALERELAAFLDFARQVAGGDLTRRAPEGDDTLGRIGRSTNSILENFAVALRRARDAALSVASSAGEILAAARQIAQGAQRQTDEVNTTSTAVEQMAASMSLVSKNAVASAEAAHAAQQHVVEGDRSVSDTFSAMTRIDEAARRTAEKMRLLEKRSTEISDVIELIDEVAAQTKLLSLNAAIEAAHAGEAGLGFNVVAEEIRKLAERTARATKDVGALIEGIQAEIAEALAAMDGGVREVGQGRTLAEQARATLQQISGAVGRAAQLSRDISDASGEQAGVTRELARTMQTITNITLESATGAQQATHTLTHLVTLAEQLTEELARFKVPDEH